MDFRNLTPFHALCFSALDPGKQEHRVIAMKVGYRLVPIAAGYCSAEAIADEPYPLCTADTFYAEEGTSSTYEESDLAPYKPKCDVLLRGHAHAPDKQTASAWDVRIRLSAPSSPAQPVLLDKRLHVTGPRQFLHRFTGWHMTRPEPLTTLPLRWEYAFGGRSVVPNPNHGASADTPAFLLNEVCFSNPIGCGWIEKRHPSMARKAKQPLQRIPAPQIEYVNQGIRKPVVARHPQGELTAAQMNRQIELYRQTPAGFGAIGRSWAPRLALAGSYDETWLKTRWPHLPEDFDFGYWNCAPADQQIAYLPPGTRLELWNLATPDITANGHLQVDLPTHKPFVLLRLNNGSMVPLPLLTDTVVIDTDTLTVSLTHRVSVPQGTPTRVAEARFETDPEAPLLKVAMPDGKNKEKPGYGR